VPATSLSSCAISSTGSAPFAPEVKIASTAERPTRVHQPGHSAKKPSASCGMKRGWSDRSETTNYDITEICSLAASSRSTSVLRKRSSKRRRHDSEAARRSSARIFITIVSEVVVTVAERWGESLFAR
jgi:hypothetical protein